MASIPQSVHNSRAARISLACRRLLLCVIVVLLALLVLQSFVVVAYHVPTGSMAPALLGHHRVCACPRCGRQVEVGRLSSAPEDQKSFCPNCGLYPLAVAQSPEVPGDQILVDTTAFMRRAPSRWEIVVFRLLDLLYIKRLLGLPGEEVRIDGGDLYVDGRLCRKTLDEARRMRVLVFDAERAPQGGWRDRWEASPSPPTPLPRWGEGRPEPSPPTPLPRRGEGSPEPSPPTLVPQAARGERRSGVVFINDIKTTPDPFSGTLTYRNFSLDTRKSEPMRDEYAYNGGVHADSACVHDFLIDAEIETKPGRGALALRLCDGCDWVEVLLPVGDERAAEAFAWPIDDPQGVRKLADTEKRVILRSKQRYRVEMAFVDRRLSLALNGQLLLEVDLPEATARQGVVRPFQVQADGVEARLHGFRLYRDVHYGQQGRNAVHGKSVRLGADQYFMLGDNSPNSEDSRWWPDDGRVRAADLIGPMVKSSRLVSP